MRKLYYIFISLAAIHRILNIYARNSADFSNYNSLFVTSIASICAFILLFEIITQILHNKEKAFLITLLSAYVFFSYSVAGHLLFLGLEKGWAFSRLRYFIPVYLVCIAVITWLIFKHKKPETLVRFAMVFTGIIILQNIIVLAGNTVTLFKRGQIDTAPIISSTLLLETLPDVYYIILDAYAREDVLRDYYSFDNSAFTDSLNVLGFYIAEQSKCNYPETDISLSSSLNMRYFKDEGDWERIEDGSLFQSSRVFRIFKGMGYTLVNFCSGIGESNNIRVADIQINTWYLDEFSSLLLNTTFLHPVLPVSWYRRAVNTFHALQNLSIDSPKFVFAHMIIPHPPYACDADGVPTPRSIANMAMTDYVWRVDSQYYIEYLKYCNKMTLATIRSILDNSPSDPIIIIQADHGPATEFDTAFLDEEGQGYYPEFVKKRVAILNAFHFPEGVFQDNLYADISPVNSFRFILHHIYGMDFKPLDDISYYRPLTILDEYNWRDVTAMIGDDVHTNEPVEKKSED